MVAKEPCVEYLNEFLCLSKVSSEQREVHRPSQYDRSNKGHVSQQGCITQRRIDLQASMTTSNGLSLAL